MTPKTLYAHLCASLPHKAKTLIVGAPGVGKSDIVEKAARAVNADLVLMHPAVADPTDYKGMPAVTHAGTEAHFLPFVDLNQLIQAKRLMVCFFDDIGQAPHSVQAALMQLILARQVNGHRISDHVVFVGATNDSSHRAGVNTILKPVKSRWDTIVPLNADVKDWVDWALTEGDMPPEIVGFIQFRPELLCKFEPTRELKNSPSPRTVAAVGRWVKMGITDLEVLSGAAGEGFAAEFMGFLKVYRGLPDLDFILANPKTAQVPKETDMATLYAVSSGLAHKAKKEHAAAIFSYADRLPKEFAFNLILNAQRKCRELATTQEFTKWAVANHHLLV